MNGDGSSSNVNINENFRVDSSGNCTANSLNASQGGTIGPYSIGSGALTGNGVTLKDSEITIGGVTLNGEHGRLAISSGIMVYGKIWVQD
jgi:hypothetical protein